MAGSPAEKRTVSPVAIELDGRTLEGGDLGHSWQPSRGGGLKAQHLACVKWLAHACDAKVEGVEKGSKILSFDPGVVHEVSPAFTKKALPDGRQVYECRLDIGTAGSTGLALQAILPFVLFARRPSGLPVRLTISGGTNVSGSPSYEYITQVLLPTLRTIGFPDIKASLGKRGWSHGGSSIGNFTLEIPSRQGIVLPSFQLCDSSHEPRKPRQLKVTFVAPSSCFEHFRSAIRPAIKQHFGDEYDPEAGNMIVSCEGSLHEKRMYLLIVATVPAATGKKPHYSLGQDWLYDRRIRSHEIAASEMIERMVADLANEWKSGAWVDEYMRDQLVIFQALADRKSEMYPGVEGKGEEKKLREPSLHTRTAEWVAKQILGAEFDGDGACEGIGYCGDHEKRVRNTGGASEADIVSAIGDLSMASKRHSGSHADVSGAKTKT